MPSVCGTWVAIIPRALNPQPFPDSIFSSLLQPILSPSILDHLINNDRKLPPEYNLPHTYVEMQVRSHPSS